MSVKNKNGSVKNFVEGLAVYEKECQRKRKIKMILTSICLAVLWNRNSFYLENSVENVGLVEVELKNMKFSEFPMVMAHDAATTYLESSLANDFAKTQQSGGLAKLFDCGARAFDLRPGPKVNGQIVAHHGPVTVHRSIVHMIDDLLVKLSTVKNLKRHPLKNFILLAVDELKPSLEDEFEQILQKKGIRYIPQSECLNLQHKNMIDVIKLAHVENSEARILAVNKCWEENYDPNIVCTGYGFDCYKNSSDSIKQKPWNLLSNYLDKFWGAKSKSFRVDGLYSIQALWQESVQSAAASALKGSNLIKDEIRSELNGFILGILQKERSNLKGRVNLLEMNAVCDQGDLIKSELWRIVGI
eukprot:snap_masked-scaffold_2-processed-gene-11.20-mRNA-1 protein AED:1.00 eAED:1.00 QI:0/0/0/0/1/1/2/0/357